MMFYLFIFSAVLVVVSCDTLVENFYVKLKDLQNQYNSEIGELQQLNNEQRNLIENLTDVIEQTSLKVVVNEQRRVLEKTNQTVEYLREMMEEMRSEQSEQRQVLQTTTLTMANLTGRTRFNLLQWIYRFKNGLVDVVFYKLDTDKYLQFLHWMGYT